MGDKIDFGDNKAEGGVHEVTAHTPTPETDGGGPSLDDLFEEGVTTQALEEAEQAMMLPEATYTTVPALTLTPRQNDAGRRYGRFYGKVVGEKDGSVGFNISATFKNKFKDGQDQGTPDLQSRLFTQAVRTYETATGEKYDGSKEARKAVFEFIRDFPVRLRLIRGTDSPIVVSISPVRD